MKYFFKSLSGKQLIILVLSAVCLLLWSGLALFYAEKKNSFPDQTAALRWSPEGNAAQISCFFTESSQMDKDKIRTFEEKVNQKLQEASIVVQEEGARLWADAYSAQGSITMVSERTSLEANAVGVGGDFFLFHPLLLLKGAYFSGDDLMADKVVIDEEAAWQLFGSNDVIGMKVEIGGVPHYISGVVRRADGHINEAAGLNKTMVYVSFETLSELGKTEGINTYEIMMPNPVKNFAYTMVKEQFGLDEASMWVVENSSRYGIEHLLTVIAEFGTRSMNSYAVRYPYWENAARGWEDILALALILQLFFLLVPLVTALVFFIRWWKRRQWTWKDILRLLGNGKDKITETFYKEKNKWKYF